MSQVLVETLHAARWRAENASASSAADKAVRVLGPALGVVLFLSCAVLVEWRAWVLRRRELAGAWQLETHPVV